MKTLDAHQDKVWGLHGSRKDDKMVTGSADSNITVWLVSVVLIDCKIRKATRFSCLAIRVAISSQFCEINHKIQVLKK